jgi:hypothetical protein
MPLYSFCIYQALQFIFIVSYYRRLWHTTLFSCSFGKSNTELSENLFALRFTGIGKHSKGQASLPAAVRGFLIENGYRFDELRPGVFNVRPKFRRR